MQGDRAGFFSKVSWSTKYLSPHRMTLRLPALGRGAASSRGPAGAQLTSTTAPGGAAAGPHPAQGVCSLHIYSSQRLYKILIKLWCGDGL